MLWKENDGLCNGFDGDFGKRLTVAVHLLVAFAPFFLENQDFIAFEVADNANFYFGIRKVGLPNANLSPIFDEHNAVQLHGIPFFGIQPVYIHALGRAHFELLALNINDGNHGTIVLIGLRIYAQFRHIHTRPVNLPQGFNRENGSQEGSKGVIDPKNRGK